MAPLPDLGYPPVNEKLMGFLSGMYEAHGTSVVRSGNWLVLGDGRLLSRVARFDSPDEEGRSSLQMDVVTVVSRGRHIVESFAGLGATPDEALEDACVNFRDSTFHALYSALLDPACDHVDRDSWIIDSIPREVTLGWLRLRGHFPKEHWEPIYAAIRGQMEGASIGRGLHWVRYFYAHIPGREPATEVLVDNEPVEAFQEQLAAFPWPDTEATYTARLFFIIQDAGFAEA
ncbi:MAG: DUF6348 family protein [Luteolibacter sp.]